MSAIDLASLGVHRWAITPSTISAVEEIGPLASLVSALGSDMVFSVMVRVLHAAIVGAEGDNAPSIEEVAEACAEIGVAQTGIYARQVFEALMWGKGGKPPSGEKVH